MLPNLLRSLDILRVRFAVERERGAIEISQKANRTEDAGDPPPLFARRFAKMLRAAWHCRRRGRLVLVYRALARISSEQL